MSMTITLRNIKPVRLCRANTQQCLPCGNHAVDGSNYCKIHEPVVLAFGQCAKSYPMSSKFDHVKSCIEDDRIEAERKRLLGLTPHFVGLSKSAWVKDPIGGAWDIGLEGLTTAEVEALMPMLEPLFAMRQPEPESEIEEARRTR